MIPQNKIILYLSLVLNLFFVCLSIIFVIKKGGIVYLSNKVSLLIEPTQSELRRHSSQDKYDEVKNKIFQQLSNSNQAIVLVGDSLTHQGQWIDILQTSNLINGGISGDTTQRMLNRLDEIIEAKPRKIFIMIGTNDIWNEHRTVDEVIANYRKILDLLKTKSPQTTVYIQSLLPINNINYNLSIDNNDLSLINNSLRQLAQEFNYPYIDLHSSFINPSNQLNPNYTYDGVHLNGKGYLLWGNLIQKYVKN